MKPIHIATLTMLVAVLISEQAHCADATSTSSQTKQVGTVDDNTSPPEIPKIHVWTDTQWKLTWGIAAFTAFLIGGQYAIMFCSKTYWTNRQFKAFTMTLIVAAALIVIIAGFSDSQIAPIMGLIGTIAGYILGSPEKSEKVEKPNRPLK